VQDSTFVRTAEMWQAVAPTFERNASTFDCRAALRLCQGHEFVRRRTKVVCRCAHVLE
jgi:hypothetical protein